MSRARRLDVQFDVNELFQMFVVETTFREVNFPIWGNHLVAGLGASPVPAFISLAHSVYWLACTSSFMCRTDPFTKIRLRSRTISLVLFTQIYCTTEMLYSCDLCKRHI
jgi:hypothetical protein